ncbi:epoxide hydrolase family protein [Pseudonocardia sp. GCM10023141]|uniref:epoxide hydrolase family protein n=1 Tax=Pseudonocardia sp. GCM10023141 TaxID=3252653 RepID=UPI003614B5D9
MSTTYPLVSSYEVAVPESDIADLRERLARTRWPDRETVDDWSQGIPLGYLQEVCEYWRTEYDWRRFEARINRFPQGLTTIDGVDIHFVHAPSPHPDATPLIITHGWPGSVAEYLDVIEPLRDPTNHGGEASDAYHVVVPSVPGYGFGGKPTRTGWGVDKIAETWVELMARLGYDRFLAQGGDWGSRITMSLGIRHSHAVRGIHLNLAICDPAALRALGEPTEQEQAQLGLIDTYQKWESGYSVQQSTRPQTLGYGLTDSPAGQCAWILEKFRVWTDCAGHPENAVSRDHLLDNISVFWFNACATSAGRLYWESYESDFGDFTPVEVPTAYSAFQKDALVASQRWARTRYPDLRYFTEPSPGGHFAAMEQPALFVEEVRAGLRTLTDAPVAGQRG